MDLEVFGAACRFTSPDARSLKGEGSAGCGVAVGRVGAEQAKEGQSASNRCPRNTSGGRAVRGARDTVIAVGRPTAHGRGVVRFVRKVFRMVAGRIPLASFEGEIGNLGSAAGPRRRTATASGPGVSRSFSRNAVGHAKTGSRCSKGTRSGAAHRAAWRRAGFEQPIGGAAARTGGKEKPAFAHRSPGSLEWPGRLDLRFKCPRETWRGRAPQAPTAAARVRTTLGRPVQGEGFRAGTAVVSHHAGEMRLLLPRKATDMESPQPEK